MSSMQSDVEILSVLALENYARKHGITENEAAELFHKYQVFEKIMIQYEYLHQVDINETLVYVEEIIAEGANELIVYHGNNLLFDKIDLSKSHDKRDFGKGFYTTILEIQAKEWANKLYLRKHHGSQYVYQYVFYQAENLKIKRFDSLSSEWLAFIKENRSMGGLQHGYDIIIGPVADDNTMQTIQFYISGIYTAQEAIERLRYSKINNQVSFHTPEALKYLKLIRRECYE